MKEGEGNVKLINERQRLVSCFYRFKVISGPDEFRLIVKCVPQAKSPIEQEVTSVQRARMVPPLNDYGKRLQLEYTALEAIHNHFKKFNNPSFGTIRVLDFMEKYQAIIMEENFNPSLLSLFAKTCLFRNSFYKVADLNSAFYNAGAWLNAYREVPNMIDAIPRHSSRDSYNESILELTNYLSDLIGDKQFFEQVEEIVHSNAMKILPENLPLGLGHGDYAMRNILVGKSGIVTVIDTAAKFYVPIYEDIAYFLVRLRLNKLHLLTRGLFISDKMFVGFQSEFLSGYFGKSKIPSNVINLFMIQSLLDNWSSKVSFLTHQSLERSPIHKKIKLKLLNKYYRVYLKYLLQQVN